MPVDHNLQETVPIDLPALDEQEVDFRAQFEVAWRRRWLILGVGLACVLLGLAWVQTRRAQYEASTKISVYTDSSKASSALASDPVLASLSVLENSRSVGTQVEIMKSLDTLDVAFAKLTPEQQMKGFGANAIPTWSYTFDSKSDSDIVTVTTRAYTAKLAALLANKIFETYKEQDLKSSTEATKDTLKFVRTGMVSARDQLSKASVILAGYKRDSKLIAADVQVQEAAKEVADLRVQATQTKTDAEAASVLVSNLERQIQKMEPEVPSASTIQENPEFTFSRNRLSVLTDQLTTALQEYTEKSPEVQAIRNQIKETQTRLQTISQNIVTSTQRQANPILEKLATDYASAVGQQAVQQVKQRYADSTLKQREGELLAYPEQQRRLAELTSDVATFQHTYDSLLDKASALEIQETSTVSYAMQVAIAREPKFPAYPQKILSMLIAVIMGGFLGVAAALVAEKLDTRVHDPQLAERMTGVPTLTAIPEAQGMEDAPDERLLIGQVEHNHAFVESFRLLRNNVMFSSPDKELKTLAITSASKSEGKSTVSVNLAIALAMDGKKVIIVDGDLRRPTVHQWMKVGRETGLTTVVKGLSSLENTIKPTAHENLDCLPAGPLPPNPTEFLNSQQTRQLLHKLTEMYDIVLIDSPPCTGLSDVQVISTIADGMVLVVALDNTSKQYLMATIRMLRQAGANLLGTVLNRVQYQRSAYGYYSYYYYYYYQQYGEDEEKGKKKKGKRKGKRRAKPPEEANK